jgi:hypothetical protein
MLRHVIVAGPPSYKKVRMSTLLRFSTLAMSAKRSLGRVCKHEKSVWQTETLPKRLTNRSGIEKFYLAKVTSI